ncbi:ABC transporter ATP-binding protein [Flavobacterium urocaniciphilum]|uniref:ABC-2 type transport system ATP-binding protein n=1 Tax=Flavobacterium urocaniciphilum TaxID=1299341 RepID=A0A1H8YSP2_9FLAO|nr:ATP-binding cassette domain-containing protein [Flavobacterium urocaniciphilum]SEP55157.1 ABC-2 type transport system ATP-binding protein [Flavobacterium urocaniciphilum]
METILKITNLHKKYRKVHAVNNVSVEIKKGNVYGILGPNGSGKSTTLGIVLNVVNKTSGEFEWFDGTYSTHDALKKVGAIIERPNFYPYMTAEDNLKLVCKIKNIPYTKVFEKLELVGLLDRKDSKFKTFSLGMKQRLAIASALLNDPEILILDEPTNGLDPQGIRQIRDLIKVIANQGTTILLASHLLDEVEKVCSHVIVIRNGVTLYQGTVDGMVASEGFFELESENLAQLESALQQLPQIEKIEKDENKLLVYLKSHLEPGELNTLLFKQNITLTHLVKRKNSLEEQFLELTKH